MEIQKILKIKRRNWEFYVHSVVTILTLLDIENIVEYVSKFKEMKISFFKCFSDEYKDILTPEFYPKEIISKIIEDKINLINSKYNDENSLIAINFLQSILDNFEQIQRSDIQTKLSVEYINDLDSLRPYKKTFSDFLIEKDNQLFEYLNKRKAEILNHDNN